jgi:hypothetical protein
MGAQSSLAKFGAKVEGYSRKATIALAGIGAAAFQTVQAASNLNEEISKSEVVFGDAADQIQKFAKTASKELGLSERAALQASSNFAVLGQSAGLTGKELGTFASDLTTLASDLASFNNTTTDEAITALAAGLRGESEPLRRFGVLLSAAAVEAKAMELGLAKTTKEITDQDKVLARQALILEQTTIQQGDFARTADGAANKQRILAADVENTKAKIGEGLLPVYQQLLDLLIPSVEKLEENAEGFTKIGVAVAAVSAAIVALNYAIKIIQITITVFSAVAAGFRLLMLTVAAATGSATAAQTLAELTYKRSTAALVAYTIAEKIKTAGTLVATAAQAALNFVMTANPIGIVIVALAALAAGFSILYDKSERFRNMLKSVWEWIKKVGTAIKEGVLGRIADVAGDFGDIFRANGGPVRQGQSYIVGERGPELFTASTSGSISPSGSFGGSGQNIVINMNGVIDGESARRTIEKLLQDSARRTGAINLSGATL